MALTELLRKRTAAVSQTIAQLHAKVVHEWANLSRNYKQRHVTPMQRGCQAVINSHDGHTWY